MKRIETPLLLGCGLLLVFGACQPAALEESPEETAAYEPVLNLPLTTDSEEARAAFMEGLEANDMGRFNEARQHFHDAIAADPEFATGYLAAASVANSYSDFVGNLRRAVEHAAGASEAEQAWITSVQKSFENDDEAALEAAMKAAELAPESPRAWAQVAQAHAALGDYERQRATLQEVLADYPDFLPAYFQLANSYLFNEPRNFAKAEAAARKMVELAPGEQNSHDILGDVHRAQGNLEAARDDYTRAAELAPDNGSPLQQRGHVNSFLGNWEQARADYDRAMELEPPQVAATFGIWRGLVAVHEGKPADAIAEFEAMIEKVDEMDLDDSLTAKIGYLYNVILIATHTGMYDKAADAIERSRVLRMKRLEQTGAEEDRNQQEAAVTWAEGMLAARKGDYATARAKAEAYMELVAEDTDPQKNELAHEIMGLADLLEGNAESAVAHYERTSPSDPYAKYHLGLACEAADDTERANQIFGDLAAYNFNAAGYALIRADVLERAPAG